MFVYKKLHKRNHKVNINSSHIYFKLKYRVQNFRLHQNALKQHQSKDVSRINRMFNRCVTEKMDLNQNKTEIR